MVMLVGTTTLGRNLFKLSEFDTSPRWVSLSLSAHPDSLSETALTHHTLVGTF